MMSNDREEDSGLRSKELEHFRGLVEEKVPT